MFGLLNLWCTFVDLDADWVAQVEFELISDKELRAALREGGPPADWRTCSAWFAPLLLHSLRNGATALHLLRDRRELCLRQLVWGSRTVPEDEREWYELLPMPRPLMDRGIRAVRLIACMMPWSRKGWIHYRFQGKRSKARCVQEAPDDLVIYFSADRPALHRLTDTFGVPTGRTGSQ
jgi:hypothetical protein